MRNTKYEFTGETKIAAGGGGGGEVSDKMPCPQCHGSGSIMARVQFTDRRRPCQDRPMQCPECNGERLLPRENVEQWQMKYGSRP
jgi:DnaJ-class molecular chaperone